MTNVWLCPDQLFDGNILHRNMAMQIEKGEVVAVSSKNDLPENAICKPISGTVTPGYLDLQVNGGGGVLLNETPTTEGMIAIAMAHRKLGSVAIMPTVITDAPLVLAQAVDAAIAARHEPSVVGLHIEGPHIAPSRRGTHAEGFVRPLDDTTISLVRRLRGHEVPVLITVAPEAATGAQIAELCEMGAVVSLGHSDASAKATRAAFLAGANCVTHLFNAMPPMLNRAPGIAGAAINSDAFTGIICDGVHVADEMVGLAIRARPVRDRMFLVSDAMPTVGGPDHFDLYGQTIHLDAGRLVNSDGSLAGAHTTLAQGVARLVADVGIDLQDALRMAITIPAILMRVPHLSCLVGRKARDVLVLDQGFSVVRTLEN